MLPCNACSPAAYSVRWNSNACVPISPKNCVLRGTLHKLHIVLHTRTDPAPEGRRWGGTATSEVTWTCRKDFKMAALRWVSLLPRNVTRGKSGLAYQAAISCPPGTDRQATDS